MATWKQIIEIVKLQKPRSAWGKGVKWYAFKIIANAEVKMSDKVPADPALLRKKLLMGAKDWYQYSEGGFALIYNGDIAKKLCSPSELKKVKSKEGYFKNPNPREDWLQVQGRALTQAFNMILSARRAIKD